MECFKFPGSSPVQRLNEPAQAGKVDNPVTGYECCPLSLRLSGAYKSASV